MNGLKNVKLSNIFFILDIDRGLSGSKKVPFRKWYGCLGELTCSIPKGSNSMDLTATATRSSNKQQIQHTLKLPAKYVYFIQESPKCATVHGQK